MATMRLRASYYQQFDADPSLDVPGEGYGGWQEADVEISAEHTAVVVMHAWDAGTQTQFYVSSNGFLSFGSGSSALTNQCPLPNATAPNNIVALMWDDLYPNYGSGGAAVNQTYMLRKIAMADTFTVNSFVAGPEDAVERHGLGGQVAGQHRHALEPRRRGNFRRGRHHGEQW